MTRLISYMPPIIHLGPRPVVIMITINALADAMHKRPATATGW